MQMDVHKCKRPTGALLARRIRDIARRQRWVIRALGIESDENFRQQLRVMYAYLAMLMDEESRTATDFTDGLLMRGAFRRSPRTVRRTSGAGALRQQP